jgi:hypothetical protein
MSRLFGTVLRVVAVVWVLIGVMRLITLPSEVGTFVGTLVLAGVVFWFGTWLRNKNAE